MNKQQTKQFNSLKRLHPDCILLFRDGDFYYAYGEDAQAVSTICNLTLYKSRLIYPEGACAFPYHALDTFLPRLIRADRRVVIAEWEAPVKEIITPKNI